MLDLETSICLILHKFSFMNDLSKFLTSGRGGGEGGEGETRGD